MNPMLRLSTLFLVVILKAPLAFAHDGWVEFPALVEKGQPVTISLLLGNHSNEHKSYRLAGKWKADVTKLVVIEPSGKLNDISSALIDLGEDAEKTGPKGPKGFHIAAFTPKEEGVYVVLARQEEVAQHGDGPKFRGVRSARGAFAALRIPRLSEGKKLSGFARTHGIENLMEIVPVSNPIAVMQSAPATFELRYKGKPFPNQAVTVVR